jgi:hypothetical protein
LPAPSSDPVVRRFAALAVTVGRELAEALEETAEKRVGCSNIAPRSSKAQTFE